MVDEAHGLLRELLTTYGPCGQEDAVRDVCRRELEPLVDETSVDPAGNLVGVLRGGDAPAVPLMAHMDELSMIVKRVEPDGTLHVAQLGTMYPGNFGLGPVSILGDDEILCGVITLGSEHTTNDSQRIWETKPDQGDKAMDWHHVYVFTGRSSEELAAAGVHPGTRVCIHHSKRTLIEFGDYLGCYFMDDRAAVTALLQAAQRLSSRVSPLAGDVYFVFTANEEVGGVGGSYASRCLPGDLTIALEVGPTEAEYQTTCAGGPIIAYSDAECVYDKTVADSLMAVAAEREMSPQAAVLGAFESDASHSKASALAPRAGLLCLPTLSTHGYEVIRRDAIGEMAQVLVGFLERWA
ncbi:M42 family metallopeptidase [Mycobacterium sp. AZCC_0083]|uniref:M42 family metallopeptidase n=1 Tax=Mycobacterium sp. AZCC_0083 TaxID=2735882 RepID=UPI001607B55D|nr:peptidase M42 [Mycobacterium sp. AZCC_0083]MBB5167485.1 putative aminopeptidase FrvX [Mycobacterium sp. AZCC_0083]